MSEIIFSLKILYLFSKLFNNKQETIVKDIILVPIQKWQFKSCTILLLYAKEKKKNISLYSQTYI